MKKILTEVENLRRLAGMIAEEQSGPVVYKDMGGYAGDVNGHYFRPANDLNEGDVVGFPDQKTPSAAHNPKSNPFIDGLRAQHKNPEKKSFIKPDQIQAVMFYIVDQATWRSSEWGRDLIYGQFREVGIPYTPENIKWVATEIRSEKGRQLMRNLLASDENYWDQSGGAESEEEGVEEALAMWYDDGGGLFDEDQWRIEYQRAKNLAAGLDPDTKPKQKLSVVGRKTKKADDIFPGSAKVKMEIDHKTMVRVGDTVKFNMNMWIRGAKAMGRYNSDWYRKTTAAIEASTGPIRAVAVDHPLVDVLINGEIYTVHMSTLKRMR